MAYITVSPNPVGVTDPAYGAYASGVWDVQDGPQEVRAAEVVVSINGAPSIPFMGPGFFGRFVYPVNLPNTYEFIFRYADTKLELTRVEVQTYKAHEIATEYSSETPTTISAKALFAIDGDGQLHARDEDGGNWSPAAAKAKRA